MQHVGVCQMEVKVAWRGPELTAGMPVTLNGKKVGRVLSGVTPIPPWPEQRVALAAEALLEITDEKVIKMLEASSPRPSLFIDTSGEIVG